MRTITGNIKSFTENIANIKIDFVLCNTYGKELNIADINYKTAIKKSTTTDENGNFSISLYETEQSDIKMFYKMLFPDNDDIPDIKLYIQEGVKEIDFLKLLYPMPKLEMFYEIKNQQLFFNAGVTELFENFFVNENIFTNTNENNFIKTYISFADNERESDLMSELDKYLGSVR